MGASSSSKLGCLMKMSLEATQSCLISDSESWTCLPGRANRTSVSRWIMSSSAFGSMMVPCCCPCVVAIWWLIFNGFDWLKNQRWSHTQGENQREFQFLLAFGLLVLFVYVLFSMFFFCLGGYWKHKLKIQKHVFVDSKIKMTFLENKSERYWIIYFICELFF